MKKKEILIKTIGIICIVWPFLYNHYSILRIISEIIGISIWSFTLVSHQKKRWIKGIIVLIVNFLLLFGIDFLLVKYCNRIPIISYEIESSNTVSTYNSFYYRVYNCNGKRTFDAFYKKNYLCEEELTEENVNSLLSHITNNFADYRGKFVNVHGKISTISGSTSIAMQTFETTDKSINGQVSFSDNITLIIMNNGNLEKVDDLKIYDTINVIGRIEKIKKNGQNKEIIMQDAKIINRPDFQNYEIDIVANKKCEADLKLISKTDTFTYYTHCLDSIYVKYGEENVYDLGYILTDKRMTFEMLIDGKEKEENEFEELYKLGKLNLMKCKNSNNIVLGSKSMNLDTNYCESFDAIENSEDFEGV